MADQGYARDEQELWIQQASKNVKKSAFYMRKAIVSAGYERVQLSMSGHSSQQSACFSVAVPSKS